MTGRSRSALAVFLVLWLSFAYFWHRRDWNTASRLMLTYALVDRGTLSINGLEDQTGDKAVQGGRYYSDKLPGYSLLAAVPYAVAKPVLGIPSHPLGQKGFPYWSADYWVTVFTSGLLTAATGALLVIMAGRLGLSDRAACLIGLSYGLATPATVYASLAYGHQTSAFCLLASFFLLWDESRLKGKWSAWWSGFLAAYASLVEIQVGPVSAILGFYLIAQVIGRRRPAASIVFFGLGALGPTLILLLYNFLAFGSPLTMGYFLHANPRFRGVHSSANPLGVNRPQWQLFGELLWGTRRGLLWYAPILLLMPLGLVRLIARKEYAVAVVSTLIAASVFVMNLSYPEWTGGWSTGPRLLTPMLPFAMLLVAGALTINGRALFAAAAVLGLVGLLILLLFQGIGGRVPEQGFPEAGRDVFNFPLRDLVIPTWVGEPVPGWLFGDRFARNLFSMAGAARGLAPSLEWVQFLPLLLVQALGIGLIMALAKGSGGVPGQPVSPERQEAGDRRPDAVG